MDTLRYDSVPIYLGESFENIFNYIPNNQHNTVLFLIDENVFLSWKSLFEEVPYILIPSGESQKSLAFIETIVHQLIEKKADRNTFLVGVGGGVVCDITGFVASIFMRGIPFAFVPTTLLAQVDASIGGKNGVNTSVYKNMIGVFRQPQFILIDLHFLLSLPKEEFIHGMAEVIKHACIYDQSYFEYIENNIASIISLKPPFLYQTIYQSIAIKCAIVGNDLYEQGDRKLLNFGHTLGHPIEQVYHLPHGQAISIGMIVANRIAEQKNLLESRSASRVQFLLHKTGLPTDSTFVDIEKIKTIAKHDKKKQGDIVHFILLKSIGDACIYPLHLDDILL